ncbi:class I lanthipeptide [Taibaiella koreensis]|uniref:class I lanthipeptide n=1 Tax=Taibaiella koreensis TaxID=1268548 RepID=UPI0013C2C076|nr:class I lanthipeptide [Taibaiella koreensis]
MKKKKLIPAPKLRLEKKTVSCLDAAQQQNVKGGGLTVDIPCLSHKPNSICDDC